MNLKHVIIAMRPHQWTKNFLVFAGLIFSGNLTDGAAILMSLKAFAVFCLGSSGIYILNDVVDRKCDAEHPQKRLRPIASGQIKIPVALGVMCGMSIVAVAASISLFDALFSIVFIGYFLLMIAYLFVLKHIVILDLIAVALGFVLRALAGAVALDVEISPWLIICTFLLALLLLMGKRRHEILILRSKACEHRSILKEYSLRFLDQLIAVVTSSAVITYSLYTFSGDTVQRLGTHLMPLTIPFVIYGIFRYLYLTHQKNLGGAPEELFVFDAALLTNTFLWGLTVMFILYLV